MPRRKSTLFLYLFSITVLSACNLPIGAQNATATPDLALTITALANNGQEKPPENPESNETPASPAETQSTATPQFTATPDFTATPSVPEAKVSTNTNCRTGPGVIYDLIDALLVGQTAEVVGKNSGAPNYWVIKRINGSGTCWLWGEYATISGNINNLPEYPIPPTPTPTATPTFTPTPPPPAAVSNLVANKACTTTGAPPGFYYAGGTITWKDNSNNETGFKVYVGADTTGKSVAENTTVFPIPPLLVSAGQPITMGVDAYNDSGKSAKVDVTFSCP